MAAVVTTSASPPEVPPDLDSALSRYFGDEGRLFADELPARVATLARRWSLEVGPALAGARTAFVAPCRRSDGSDAVLRVGFPEQVPGGEAEALRAWAGKGSVRLLESDESERALLLERCLPGTWLSVETDPDGVLDIGARLLRRLWRAEGDGTYLHLSELATRRVLEAETRRTNLDSPLDPALVDEGIALWGELSNSGAALLLHADFHPRNVLSARREPWLVIDPKPLVGDPAYEPVPLVLEAGGGPGRPGDVAWGEEIARRVRKVSEPLGLDAQRVAAWGVARSVDWTLFLAAHGQERAAAHAAADAEAFAALV